MITSVSNDYIKYVRSLHDKKNRDQTGLFIVTGEKLVKTAIDFGCVFHSVIVGEKTDKYAELLASVKFDSNGRGVAEVSDEVFKSVAREVTPQGILAVLHKPNKKPAGDGAAVLLDGVADPSNVGAILRTALASGYKNVFVTEGVADPFSPKAVRASMGGALGVNVIEISREEIKKIDKPMVIADMFGENVFGFNPPKEFCLAIGNEGSGISEQVRNAAEYSVSIPMQGGMESLNAAVSAGILMYALKEKIRNR